MDKESCPFSSLPFNSKLSQSTNDHEFIYQNTSNTHDFRIILYCRIIHNQACHLCRNQGIAKKAEIRLIQSKFVLLLKYGTCT